MFRRFLTFHFSMFLQVHSRLVGFCRVGLTTTPLFVLPLLFLLLSIKHWCFKHTDCTASHFCNYFVFSLLLCKPDLCSSTNHRRHQHFWVEGQMSTIIPSTKHSSHSLRHLNRFLRLVRLHYMIKYILFKEFCYLIVIFI